MPKREDIKCILVIGSGPIIIGQACEFDYSGTQAIKTLKDLNYKVVLINSNPATIMTDPKLADRTYIEPLTVENILEIIKIEKVDAILPTMGGQTALNLALQLYESGKLAGVKFLGASIEAIKKGEDRAEFKKAMQKIGMDLPKSLYAHNLQEALSAAKEIGFPLIVRASFTLAGGGSGVAYNIDEFENIASNGLALSPISEILIEESLLGWKEYEMEVIRDSRDNCIIVCSIENVDPMGIHTGDSITIAPALTLTDKEYQAMRDASFAILREIGVDTGGSNVQFAIHPTTGRMIVIEMNPRVSRSSALASKATGYPIAKVATMLAVGYSLDEIINDMTGTPASFEPSIDYIVTKIPRFTFEKFRNIDSTLTTSMKSIGEVMAIGGSFKESLQKAINSLEINAYGFKPLNVDMDRLKYEIRRGNDSRLFYIGQGFREGLSVDEIYTLSKIDRYFLNEIKEIIDFEKFINIEILSDEGLLRRAKSMGYSDEMISKIINLNSSTTTSAIDIYNARSMLNIDLQYCKVDTCAGEFLSKTPYYYSKTLPLANSLNLDSGTTKAQISPDQKLDKVLILGGGPNRIGQGIEFDYCCVHASFALQDMGIISIMQNCNPETVSTDYDTSDTLYFEPITLEYVLSIIKRESANGERVGVIVHFGGQTPLKLANDLEKLGVNIIGTKASVIDTAEDREKFSAFVNRLNLKQPQNGFAKNIEEAITLAKTLGYPVLVRPSYVLGGRAMQIVYSDDDLANYMQENSTAIDGNLILIDKFLDRAIELDVDLISDGVNVYIGGILQHIEEAGVHSGDSSSMLPALNISKYMNDLIIETSATIAQNLGVIGLMNIQYAIYNKELYIIEVNPRASRTVPFISKATSLPLAKIATNVMVNQNLKEALKIYDSYDMVEKIKDFGNGEILSHKELKHMSVKASVFPFAKLGESDFILGPEMKSTGEVMGISDDFGLSFAKSQIASFNPLPLSGRLFMTIKDYDKEYITLLAQDFINLGFEIYATEGTYNVLRSNNIEAQKVLKLSQGRPNVIDMLKNKEIDIVINTSEGHAGAEDARQIRVQVIRNNIPYFSTIAAAKMAALAILALKNNPLKVKALQDYLE